MKKIFPKKKKQNTKLMKLHEEKSLQNVSFLVLSSVRFSFIASFLLCRKKKETIAKGSNKESYIKWHSSSNIFHFSVKRKIKNQKKLQLKSKSYNAS